MQWELPRPKASQWASGAQDKLEGWVITAVCYAQKKQYQRKRPSTYTWCRFSLGQDRQFLCAWRSNFSVDFNDTGQRSMASKKYGVWESHFPHAGFLKSRTHSKLLGRHVIIICNTIVQWSGGSIVHGCVGLNRHLGYVPLGVRGYPCAQAITMQGGGGVLLVFLQQACAE